MLATFVVLRDSLSLVATLFHSLFLEVVLSTVASHNHIQKVFQQRDIRVKKMYGDDFRSFFFLIPSFCAYNMFVKSKKPVWSVCVCLKI